MGVTARASSGAPNRRAPLDGPDKPTTYNPLMADTIPTPGKKLAPQAERALKEAAERRARQQAKPDAPKEFGGPSGPEPTRYGDWEKKGLISDF
jgi:hypothetical protein